LSSVIVMVLRFRLCLDNPTLAQDHRDGHQSACLRQNLGGHLSNQSAAFYTTSGGTTQPGR
jgi:hypothetical protein